MLVTDNSVLRHAILSIMIDRIEKDETISPEERQKREKMVFCCWLFNHEELFELSRKINESKVFDLKLYFQRLKLYRELKYAFDGIETPKKVKANSENFKKVFSELLEVEKFINGLIAEYIEKNKKKSKQ